MNVWGLEILKSQIFSIFSSQNSDLDNEQLDEIEQKTQAKNTKRATERGVTKVREMVWEKKNYSGSQDSKSNGLEWNYAKVLR